VVTPPEPLISVLMPVRNEAEHVEAAVRSVLAQTVANIEILVIDADSSDDTVRLVQAIGDPRVRVLRNERRIIPCALNIGLAAARGRFVARIDAHARVNDEYLEIAVTEMVDGTVASVGGRRSGVAATATGRAIATALSSPFGVGNSINHYADEAQDTDHASFGVTRTAVARAVGGWDETLLVNEDVDFDHRILAGRHRIRFNPDMVILWQVRETLPDLARQYRRYGRGKAAMVRKNGPSAVRARHLAAPALVVGLGGAAIVGLSGRRRLPLAVVLPYLGGLAAVSWRTAARQGPDSPRFEPPQMAAALATMHVAWGLGFIEGMVLGMTPAASSGRDPTA
jgi:succinoglycan biosynthesis protein ExoA